ncbi:MULTISPECIES: hypothetical protein [unclassified Duganella]|uniref:hypothetical protein n=1 Tax=unclassified Duganella TaxID=2636909 RepID=UPI00087497D9|nr:MULTISPECIES: hypothetical protein [unclassified Duganella]OEZ60713.1 hypothetical protein DUGA6_29350 [Duganella sp. HH105]OFA04069.1 hypothetical protein DUGA2_23380 [Duganella sp. HH101]
MTTGFIGAMANSGTLAYTAPVDAKLMITASAYGGNGALSINGVATVYCTPGTNIAFSHFIGAGQTVVISVATYVCCSVSVLEGS